MIPAAWSHLPFFTRDWPGIEAALLRETRVILPPVPLRFRALDLVAPDRVRAVIIGQDPYPEPGKGNGLCFSISAGFPWRRRDSLENIFKELQDDLHGPRRSTELDDWARQGVLLLNTALTVPAGQAAGHSRLGWHRLAQEVVAAVSRRPTAFLLWGSPAQKLEAAIVPGDHLILKTSHPSPLSVWKGFFGSRPFSRVNAWLAARGETPIDWAGATDR